MLRHPDKGARKGPKRFWPAWRYGPAITAGGEVQARVFQKPDDVPEGWVSHPSELTAKAAPAADEATPATPAAPRKKGSKAAPAPSADDAERVALIAELTAKDYDPAELAGATLDELRAVKKAESDAAD